MKIKMKKIVITLLIGLSFIGFAQTGGNFAVEKSAIAAGGGVANGGDFNLNGTIGQHDANQASTGGDFNLSGGFWAKKQVVIQPEIIFINGFEN